MSQQALPRRRVVSPPLIPATERPRLSAVARIYGRTCRHRRKFSSPEYWPSCCGGRCRRT